MVQDYVAIQDLFIYCKAYRRPHHKMGPCRTFVFKYTRITNYNNILPKPFYAKTLCVNLELHV